MKSYLDTDIKYLKGVGEARAALLAKELDIHTFGDMAMYLPHRYSDRTRYYSIAELTPDMPAVQIVGSFVSFRADGEGARRRLAALFHDGRSVVEVVWFRRTQQIERTYHVGVRYVLYGKPNFYRGDFSFVHPEIEQYEPGKPRAGLDGVYPMTDNLRRRGISQKLLRTLAMRVVEKIPDTYETLPREVVDSGRLMPLAEALRQMHAPTGVETLQKARERLKTEELFYLQLNIHRYTAERRATYRGAVFCRVGDKFNDFYTRVLPFSLTGAQKRVLREIRNDTRTGRQMNRLLQGDVGSGKTLVAFMAMLLAVDNGCQACLMAPTEILAGQHFETLREWADAIGVSIGLLTGSTGTAQRRVLHERLRNGSLDILVGTHALIEDGVKFANLGMAVIDEQHRFGVAQRARLWAKNTVAPHVLVMTATPIPRTLAMTVYGDLDVSVIDELPPGRKPIVTLLRTSDRRREVVAAALAQLKAGRQLYIVYPLIHENEKVKALSIEKDLEYVRETFSGYDVCCVHGQMRTDEKEYQMQKFVSGRAQVMVATTVIEVGVNVPNATMMIIENAERFGLSQLHQLRGRVGRGADQSYCVLMSREGVGQDTLKRLRIMTETTDGFLISEADMKMRGPGDLEGTMQSGLAFNLRVASLARDGQLVSRAREIVEDCSPGGRMQLSAESRALLESELRRRFGRNPVWGKIS